MNESFERFGLGLLLSVVLVYLVLMADFTSFVDPFIILMAIPPGLAGVVIILLFTGATLNVMSLMSVIMMTGVVVLNSILIVEFAGLLHSQGKTLIDTFVQACKIRLRPILMTSLGGLGVSVVVTVFLVPAVYLLIHGRRTGQTQKVSPRRP